jgi:hypothetical protein
VPSLDVHVNNALPVPPGPQRGVASLKIRKSQMLAPTISNFPVSPLRRVTALPASAPRRYVAIRGNRARHIPRQVEGSTVEIARWPVGRPKFRRGTPRNRHRAHLEPFVCCTERDHIEAYVFCQLGRDLIWLQYTFSLGTTKKSSRPKRFSTQTLATFTTRIGLHFGNSTSAICCRCWIASSK